MPRSKNRGGKNKFSAYFNPKHPGSFSGVSGFLKKQQKHKPKEIQRMVEKSTCYYSAQTSKKAISKKKSSGVCNRRSVPNRLDGFSVTFKI